MSDPAEIARNKALLRAVIEEYWTMAQGLDELAQHIAPGYVHHIGETDFTFEQFKGGVTHIQAFFPTLRYAVTHIVAEGDMYAVLLQCVMTHTGNAEGIAPTGKVIECTGAYHCRIVDGKIVEDWDAWMILGVFSQIRAALHS